jgi:hypothetical protein
MEARMEKLTLTALRQRLFKVADQVLETGVPVEIERHGRKLLLAPEAKSLRLARLKRRKLIKGPAESLVNEQVGEWRELRNLG